MFFSKVFLAVCFILLWNLDSVQSSFKERDKILYKDLGTLYFSPGEKTRARRTYSVPQLVCLNGCSYPQPRLVQCTNTGWDGTSNLWKCKSELDPAYALHNVEIVCEGYSSPDDPYVTVGSCSLEYSIKKRSKASTSSDDLSVFIGFFLLIALVFIIILLFAISRSRPDQKRVPQSSSTNDNNPDDGEGPQMGWNIPGMNRRKTPRSSPSYGFSYGNKGNMYGDRSEAGGEGGAGGFWTGFATGGALGYLFGGNRNAQSKKHRPNSNFGRGSTSDSTHRQSSGLFGSDTEQPSTSESIFGRGSNSDSTHRQSSGLFGSDAEQPSTSESIFGRSSNSHSTPRQSSGLFRSNAEESSKSESVTTARYRQR